MTERGKIYRVGSGVVHGGKSPHDVCHLHCRHRHVQGLQLFRRAVRLSGGARRSVRHGCGCTGLPHGRHTEAVRSGSVYRIGQHPWHHLLPGRRSGTGALHRQKRTACANLAMGGYDSLIPLDEAAETLFRVGKQLPSELRCTCNGGLCTTPCGQRLAREQEARDNAR